ncbi:MAG TPA: DUF1569 domain-containing protein [Dongiaceae bacterium]|nr:DUF1569 domain-containing protein [Dongiaceae bacterium]
MHPTDSTEQLSAKGMSRKAFLKLTAGVALAAGFSPLLAGCSNNGRALRFKTINDILVELALIEVNQPVTLQQPWSLYKILNHLAQSMEYSMTGYPQLDPPAMQAVAKLAFNTFKAQGYMSHDLGAVVPGAPEIPTEGPMEDAFQRLRNSCSDFENFTGALHPHFSYGQLTPEEWELAHSFHCADHFSSMTYQTV